MKFWYALGLSIVFVISFSVFLIALSLGKNNDYTPGVGEVGKTSKRPIPKITDIVTSKLPSLPESKPETSISLNKLLDQDVSWLDKYSQKNIRILVSGGDVIPARTANANAVSANDFTWSYRNIASYFNVADLAVINFETPLLRNCPLRDEGMVFCGDARQAEGLRLLGLDVVGLANNHAGNSGLAGLNETSKIFESIGADVVGRGP